MASSSLSNLASNLPEGIHKIKCKHGHDHEKYETCRIKYKHCNCFLEYTNVKDDLGEYKYLCCKNIWKYRWLRKVRWNPITWKTRFLKPLKYGRYYWCRWQIQIYFMATKRYLPYRRYGWLTKVQWNLITWKARFLKSLKYGRYYWCRWRAWSDDTSVEKVMKVFLDFVFHYLKK